MFTTAAKKRKTSENDDNDNGHQNVLSPAERAKRGRKNFTGKRPSVAATASSGLPQLKQRLFQKGLEDIQVDLQQPPLSSAAAAAGEDPVFCRNSIVQYALRLQQLKNLYHRPSGDVVVFGQDETSQLGLVALKKKGGSTHGTKPTILPELSYQCGDDQGIIQVAAGGLHSLFLDNLGRTFSCGADDEGQIGRIPKTDDEDDNVYDIDCVTPTHIKGFFPSGFATSNHRLNSTKNEDSDIIMVDAGISHSIFLTISGNVYTCGAYKLQDESDVFRDKVPPDDKREDLSKSKVPLKGRNRLPVHIFELKKRARFVAAGGSINAVVLEDHSLYTFGLGADGQLARSKEMTTEMSELKTGEETTIRVPKVNSEFYMIQPTQDEEKPRPNFDILSEHYFTPKPVIWHGVPKSQKMEVLHVSVGNDHMLVVAKAPGETTYHAWSAGNNAYGKLGHGDQVPVHELKKIEALKDVPIARVAAGTLHSLFVADRGNKIFACGCCKNGQLGLPEAVVQEHEVNKFCVLTPVPVAFPSNGPSLDEIGRFVDISVGEEHSLAVTSNGKLFAWGYGEYGQVGNNPKLKEVEWQPKLISHSFFGGQGTDVFVRQAAGGAQHSLVVASRYKKST